MVQTFFVGGGRIMTAEAAYPESTIAFEKRSRRLAVYLGLKRASYRLFKLCGLFALARRLTARSLRIFCYHGFSVADEHDFSPHTFMRGETFERRLRYLLDHGFPVLGLGEALDRLERGDLPPCSVVLTIDDGFYGTYSVALPALGRLGLPATVYVTTYHMAKNTPVFGLTAQYIVWKAAAASIDAADLDFFGVPVVPIRTDAEKRLALRVLIGHGERDLDEPARAKLLETLADRVGVDLRPILDGRLFGIVSGGEIRELDRGGVDVQLHSHRHSFPEAREAALAEIRDNRAALEPFVSRPLEHFCYPNGRWSPVHLPWLREAGVRSAVTCDPGLNEAGAQPLSLKRFGDSEAQSQIEFEAEVCGFVCALRVFRRAIVRLAKGPPRG